MNHVTVFDNPNAPLNFLRTNATFLTNLLLYDKMLNDVQLKPRPCITYVSQSANVAFVTRQPAYVLTFMIPVHLAYDVVLNTMMNAHSPPTTAAAMNQNQVPNLPNNFN